MKNTAKVLQGGLFLGLVVGLGLAQAQPPQPSTADDSGAVPAPTPESSSLAPRGVSTITGLGTAGRIPVFTGTYAIGNSVITQYSNHIGIGTTAPKFPLTVLDTSNTAIQATGLNIGVYAIGTSASGLGLYGLHNATTGTNAGVRGDTNSTDANAVAVLGTVTSKTPGAGSAAVRGINNSTGANGYGVYGSHAGSGPGVYGTGNIVGVKGISSSSDGSAVYGSDPAGNGVAGVSSSHFGVYGSSTSSVGVFGTTSSGIGVEGASDSSYGVYGTSTNGTGIYGSGSGTGIYGTATNGTGIYGIGSVNGVVGEANGVGDFGVEGKSTNGYAGYFVGKVQIEKSLTVYQDLMVSGTLSKGAGSFKIDHPLDPSRKYLSHSFVESPDMMNIYNGNVTTDAKGYALVQMPSYFSALNKDFRYQLTVMGQFAQAIIARKIQNNRFTIRTDKPNIEVSWQVTGVRHDAYADAHRIKVEEDKQGKERGAYLHPELFGQPKAKAIGYVPQAAAQPGMASARLAQQGSVRP